METSQQPSSVWRGPAGKPERDSVRSCTNRTRSNELQLKEGKLRLDIREFFTVRVVRHWNRLPRGVVDAPTLAVLKARLGKALRNLL